jgi:hypothetical protein
MRFLPIALITNLLIQTMLFSAEPTGPGPLGGHGTMRLGIDAGAHERLGAVLGIQYRFGLHDLLDRQTEYSDNTQLEILSLRIEALPGRGVIALDQATFLGVVRLPPITKKWEELSWKVEVGARTVREALCDRCGAASIQLGLGATVEPFGSFPLALWSLVETELLASPSFSGFFIKPSFGPRVGVRLRVTPYFNGWIFGSYRYQFAAVTDVLSAGTEWRLALDRNWALNAKIQVFQDGWQSTLGLFAYF